MAIDDRFRDREGLSAVAGCESSSRACDVVFVHGLGGGSYSTWMGDDQHAFWPAWIGADFPTVGVWTLGFRADVSAWTSESKEKANDTDPSSIMSSEVPSFLKKAACALAAKAPWQCAMHSPDRSTPV